MFPLSVAKEGLFIGIPGPQKKRDVILVMTFASWEGCITVDPLPAQHEPVGKQAS